MRDRMIFGCAALLAFAPGAALAQEVAAQTEWVLPDPATVTVPDLKAGTGLDTSNDPKYFYFQKDGVSFETAAYDVRECLSFARSPNDYPAKAPGYAVLNEVAPIPGLASTKFVPTGRSPYGMIGDMLAPILMRAVERRHLQSIMRICMGYKGYGRYPTTREAYIALTEGEPLASILMQAKVASGPKPDSERALP